MLRRSCVRRSIVDFLKDHTPRGEKFSLLRPAGLPDGALKIYDGGLIGTDPILERKCVRDWVFPRCDASFGAKPKRNAFLIMGNPGIGKSCALNAIAAYLMGKQGGDGELHILFGTSATHMNHIFKVQDEWCSEVLSKKQLSLLTDPNPKPFKPKWVWLQDTEPNRIPPFVFGAVLNVLASSPNRNNYSLWCDKMISNGCTVHHVFLPVWTWDEIECGAKACGAAEWATKERFDKFGGIPRLLFSKPTLDEDSTLEAAANSFDADAFVKCDGEMPSGRAGSATHRLIQLIPESMGVVFRRDWMTAHVARLILNRQDVNKYRQIMTFAQMNNHGLALETAVIAEIQRSRVIRASLLKADGRKGDVAEFAVPKTHVEFKSASEFLKENTAVFAVPAAKDYPFVDCFLYTGTKLYGIQITHAHTHNKTHLAVRQMIHDCNGRLLDGLILVDEDDAVARVSVKMPMDWKKSKPVSEKFQALPQAPDGAEEPTLEMANTLNDSTFCQYRWRFTIPSAFDMMVPPSSQSRRIWVVQLDGAWREVGPPFKVEPKTDDVDSLKDAIKLEMGTNYMGNPANFTICTKRTSGEWTAITKMSTTLAANEEVTAYGFVVPR